MKATINNKPCFIDWEHFTKFHEGIPVGTHCRITNATDNSILAVGQTQLNVKDQFDKKIGRKLALKRALIAGNVSRKERKAIWHNFLQTTKH